MLPWTHPYRELENPDSRPLAETQVVADGSQTTGEEQGTRVSMLIPF